MKRTTCTTYRHMMNKYILSALGNTEISDIDETVLEGFLSGIRSKKELSLNYQRTICAVIIRAMNHMKKRHHYEITVPENILFTDSRAEKMLPDGRELALLEEHLIRHGEDSTCLGILTALYTGIRIGELCALKWEDINLDEGIISIHKNLQRVKSIAAQGQRESTEILIQAPKTRNSRRIIPIPPVLLPLLKMQRKGNEVYFIEGRKKPWTEPRTLQYRFARILQQCGLESFNFHMLRHAFATRCISGGFDVKSLSEILGHSNVQITLNLYVHSSMQRKKQLMSQFDGYASSGRELESCGQ